jgi:hypothetical protein
MLSRSQPLMEGANERLKKTLKLVVGFPSQAALRALQRSPCWEIGPGHFRSCWPERRWLCGRTSFWLSPVPDENQNGHRAPNL